MVLVEKLYFDLEEVCERWSLPKRDVGYLAENGLLRVSVRLFDARIERGVYERDTLDGHPHRIPFEQAMFTGLQDLTRCDAFRVFVAGEAHVVQFDAPGDAYTALIPPTEPLTVTAPQLVVRREERDRIECSGLLMRRQGGEPPTFEQRHDYREVRLGTLRLSLGRLQSKCRQASARGRAHWGRLVRWQDGPRASRVHVEAHAGHLQVAAPLEGADRVGSIRPLPASNQDALIYARLRSSAPSHSGC